MVWELAGTGRRVSESCKDSITGEHVGASEIGIIVWIPVGCCQQLGSTAIPATELSPGMARASRIHDSKAGQSRWQRNTMEALDCGWTKLEVLRVEQTCWPTQVQSWVLEMRDATDGLRNWSDVLSGHRDMSGNRNSTDTTAGAVGSISTHRNTTKMQKLTCGNREMQQGQAQKPYRHRWHRRPCKYS